MMLEASHILGFFSAFLLVVAVAAWARVLRTPALQRLDDKDGPRTSQTELAAQLMILALGMSALAAAIAIFGWFAT